MKEIVDIEKSLAIVGEKSSLACDMLQMLLDSLDEDQNLINRAYKNKDIEKLIFKVHRLHGATLYCGVPQLTTACFEMESLLKQNQLDQIDKAMQNLNTAIDTLRRWTNDNDWQALFEVEQN